MHDTLEDCQNVSLNLLEAEFGKNVADTVKALTNVEGLYNLDELKANKIAFFVKLCDRLANIFFLKINFKESAYLKYQDQFKKIKENCPVEFNHLIMEMSDIFKELKEIQKT